MFILSYESIKKKYFESQDLREITGGIRVIAPRVTEDQAFRPLDIAGLVTGMFSTRSRPPVDAVTATSAQPYSQCVPYAVAAAVVGLTAARGFTPLRSANGASSEGRRPSLSRKGSGPPVIEVTLAITFPPGCSLFLGGPILITCPLT